MCMLTWPRLHGLEDFLPSELEDDTIAHVGRGVEAELRQSCGSPLGVCHPPVLTALLSKRV